MHKREIGPSACEHLDQPSNLTLAPYPDAVDISHGALPDCVTSDQNLIGTVFERVVPPISGRVATTRLVERKRTDAVREKGVLDRREVPVAGSVSRTRPLDDHDNGMGTLLLRKTKRSSKSVSFHAKLSVSSAMLGTQFGSLRAAQAVAPSRLPRPLCRQCGGSRQRRWS